MLAKLHLYLWSYVSKIVHLFDIFSSPMKLKNHHFKIELATNDEIHKASSGSRLLINAFDYVNEGNEGNKKRATYSLPKVPSEHEK